MNPLSQPTHMAVTLELGPRLFMPAPEFTVRDHRGNSLKIGELMGRKGLVLGFTGDMWQPASIRRILWLERHAQSFKGTGYNLALLICDKPTTLYGFFISSPTPPDFPLLADEDGAIHREFNMAKFPGIAVLDHDLVIKHKWLMPDDRVWPRINEMLDVLESL